MDLAALKTPLDQAEKRKKRKRKLSCDFVGKPTMYPKA